MMTVYVAKCHYYKQEFNEAAIKIRDAMVEFGNFNMDFFDINKGENKILNKVDPRIMILINSNLLEQIFFTLSKIAKKLLKKKLSTWIMNKMIDNLYFFNHKIFSKVINRIKNLLFSNEYLDLPVNIIFVVVFKSHLF